MVLKSKSSSGESDRDVPYGTLDLLILRTLSAMGPLHGYGIARRIEQLSENQVSLNQGSVYPALLRLQQNGWIGSKWGKSDTGRKAKFYSLSTAGEKKLETELESWQRTTDIVARVLEGTSA